MTRDDIIRMAREVGGSAFDCTVVFTYEEAERFAALVAASEREVCADICDQYASIEGIAQRCAAEIRAREKK